MHTWEYDRTQRLLTIRYAGHVDAAETAQLANEFPRLLAEMPPGFRLLTDLRELESMDYACAAHIKQVMDLSNEHGVTEVVRIIPDLRKDIGFKLMSYFHYSGRVAIVTCATLEEARQALAN